MEFYIDEVTEVKFNDKAFDSLVLPEDQKELILAFAQSQVKYKDVFDDIISGKGKGIIMLLSGGPGIGKTLTAESVAEEMKVPLYIMSAGDLGSDAYDIEENLSRILEMVANWNAVLLLDECDVFLEARSTHDIERNRIVSIFLRTLEYYEGILFLTTNRVKDMDQAFQSRIHMSLEYPALDKSARESVWRGFLSRAISLDAKMEGGAAHEINDEEVTALAGLELNGRQIKNVLKTANLLACHKGEKLAFKHLRIVLRVEGHSL
jgi:SpoVK/Ycf46/Vps4 family AAA+-type ATPase